MTNTDILSWDAISEAGINLGTVSRQPDGVWYAVDPEGFEIDFGWTEDGPEPWSATSEAGQATFATVPELLAYVREFLDTPADGSGQ